MNPDLLLLLGISLSLGFTPGPNNAVASYSAFKIGRAHVRTPVTEKSRMPSSA